VSDWLAVHIWVSGASSGGAEHVGDGSGELADVDRTGGIDYNNGSEPCGAGWFTPQLSIAAGVIRVACMPVTAAAPVPGPSQIQRDRAVDLDELSGTLRLCTPSS
jgi:hypothetical protein